VFRSNGTTAQGQDRTGAIRSGQCRVDRDTRPRMRNDWMVDSRRAPKPCAPAAAGN
jgi:hypothetical protein